VTVQRVSIRCATHRGDWKLDSRVGLPLLAWLRARPPDPDGIALALRREIAATPGVVRVLSLTGRFVRLTRSLSFTGSVLLDDGTVASLEISPTAATGSPNAAAFAATIRRVP
jgi:hypothetical protein